jgi:hypothetical protein
MFNSDYDPYERLDDIELAMTINAEVLGNQQQLILNLTKMNQRNFKMIKDMAHSMENLYNYTLTLEEEIKELREQQAAGRELRK